MLIIKYYRLFAVILLIIVNISAFVLEREEWWLYLFLFVVFFLDYIGDWHYKRKKAELSAEAEEAAKLYISQSIRNYRNAVIISAIQAAENEQDFVNFMNDSISSFDDMSDKTQEEITEVTDSIYDNAVQTLFDIIVK